MARIVNYHPRPKTTDRAILTQDLAKALAHARAKHPSKAAEWAQRLVDKLVMMRILRHRP